MEKELKGFKKFIFEQKIFIKFLGKLNFPWIFFIVQLVSGTILSYVGSWTTFATGQIAAGNIMDNELIFKFIFVSIAVTLAVLPITLFDYFVSGYITKRVRSATWNKFIDMNMKSFEQVGPQSLISRLMKDSSFAGEFLTEVVRGINTVSRFGFLFLQAMRNSSDFTYLVYPSIILGLIGTVFMSRYHQKYQVKALNATSKFTGKLSEKFADIKYIKSRNSEEQEKAYGEKIIMDEYKVTAKYQYLGTFYHTVAYALPEFMYNAALFIGGAIMIGKSIATLEDFVVFFMAGSTIPMLFMVLCVCFMGLVQKKAGLKTITQIFNMPAEDYKKGVAFSKQDSDIKFNNICFSYNENKEVLKNVSFTIPKGKMTAIVGPSGSGKTTILKLLERFYSPTGGEICFGKDNINKYLLEEWRKSFGYVVQNSPLLTGTIRDNIVYGLEKEPTEKEIEMACKLARIDFLEELEDGINTDIGESGSKLSGGQRQRIAIARALIKNPDYLLLDEATANLDVKNEVEVTEAIQNLMRGRTVIVIAHNICTVKDADKIIVLNDGMVDGEGDHNSLLTTNEIYRQFVELQGIQTC